MKLGDEESLIIVIQQYKMMLNKITSYPVSDEYISDKIKALIDLMPNCELEIFIKVCEDWVEKENSMPTPKQLSYKCFKILKEKEKEEEDKNPKICQAMVDRKLNDDLVEIEEEICKSHEVNELYYHPLHVSGKSKYQCRFHWGMLQEKIKGVGYYRIGGIFSLIENKKMSYVESEIFMHKYSKSDMNIRQKMLESLDNEHQAAVRRYENNYHKKYCLESSLASVFKEVEIAELRDYNID